MFDDDVSDEDISAEALAAMFRRSREKDRAALDDFVATERSMRKADDEGAARDQAVVDFLGVAGLPAGLCCYELGFVRGEALRRAAKLR